jgi:hypothetical protein
MVGVRRPGGGVGPRWSAAVRWQCSRARDMTHAAVGWCGRAAWRVCGRGRPAAEYLGPRRSAAGVVRGREAAGRSQGCVPYRGTLWAAPVGLAGLLGRAAARPESEPFSGERVSLARPRGCGAPPRTSAGQGGARPAVSGRPRGRGRPGRRPGKRREGSAGPPAFFWRATTEGPARAAARGRQSRGLDGRRGWLRAVKC